MERDEAMEFLTRDGGAVPCSRYGRNSEECAPVAYAVALIYQDANGDEITEELLDSIMSMVVNDSDGPAELLAEYGTGEEREEWSEYARADL